MESTPRATTREELEKIATPERFKNYTGKSLSMIDHYYDKLLHLSNMHTQNQYLLNEAKKRHDIMVNFCLEFGRENYPWIELFYQ